MLADKLAISRSNLQRKLKAITGMTPGDHIKSVRLKSAARMLAEGGYRINEVCFLVGFGSPSYFARCFHQQFGVLPKDYVGDK
jgi:AraC-like DNA-binding protein